MKIVFVLPNMLGGGTERVVALLANEFVNQGYETSILLFAGNQTVYPLDPRIEVVITGETSSGNPLIRLKRLYHMRQFYRKNRHCYIFAFSVMGAVFSVFAAAGIPHRMLVSERNDPNRMHHKKLRDWAYQRAEKLVVQTEEVMKCFPTCIQNKSVVIPNPVDGNLPEPYMGTRKKVIVSVARLEPQKNHKLLIDAFASFREEYPDYQLHLYGIGELEQELKQQVKDLQLEEKVIFKGFSKEVKNEIIDSSMFILSSDYEGISNSMIEALAMGIPAIATDCPVGGARTYIQSGENGILVPVGDSKALTEAMKQLASDPDYAATLGKNAERIKDDLQCKKIANRILKEAGI